MKIKILIFSFVMILGFVTLVKAQEVTTNTTTNSASASAGVQQQLEGFNLNGYDNTGKKTWDVNGDKADISEDKIKITNVDANFYGKENGNLTSKNGVINKTSGQVHLEDDVVITADRGTKMTTDSLDWDRNKDLVTTTDSVKITDDQGEVTGKGLTAHPNLKEASINKDVKAVINTSSQGADSSDNQKVTITSDGPMQMDQLHFHGSFEDNVVAVEESTGRQLYADKMDIWFDDKNKKIKKVICKGHVKAVQGNSSSYADEMVYTGNDELLVMKGRPKIVFDTTEAKGSGMFQKLGK